MPHAKKIKFAVVGCGHIGQRHIEVIQQNKDCELVALCDAQPIQNTSFPFFSTLEDLLATSSDIDVVNVCSPNGYHARQCLQALEARKHVVCEKPMGLRKSECEEVIFKALNVSRQVFVVMQNRYAAPIKWLKEIVHQGKLGNILMVNISCLWNRDDRYYLVEGKRHSWRGTKQWDGGPLFTQFAHFIDILYWIFGDIENIQTRMSNFTHPHSTDFDDTGNVQFNLVNGGMGSLTYSTAVWSKNMGSSITVLGTKGSVKIGGQYMNELEHCHIENIAIPVFPTKQANNHQFVIQNVVDVLQGKKMNTTNALEGMKVVEMIERIYAKS